MKPRVSLSPIKFKRKSREIPGAVAHRVPVFMQQPQKTNAVRDKPTCTNEEPCIALGIATCVHVCISVYVYTYIHM